MGSSRHVKSAQSTSTTTTSSSTSASHRVPKPSTIRQSQHQPRHPPPQHFIDQQQTFPPPPSIGHSSYPSAPHMIRTTSTPYAQNYPPPPPHSHADGPPPASGSRSMESLEEGMTPRQTLIPYAPQMSLSQTHYLHRGLTMYPPPPHPGNPPVSQHIPVDPPAVSAQPPPPPDPHPLQLPQTPQQPSTAGSRRRQPKATTSEHRGSSSTAKGQRRRSNVNVNGDPSAQITSPSEPPPSASIQTTAAIQSHNPAESPPAAILRDKKQKACAGCRRAKLKCMTEDGFTECVRCRNRGERCYFYPRNHDEDWQQTVSTDLYTALPHLAELSRAVHYMFTFMLQQQMPPPPFPMFEPYEPPERDMAGLAPWTEQLESHARQEQSSSEPKGEKRKRTIDEEEEQAAESRLSPSRPDLTTTQLLQLPLRPPLAPILPPPAGISSSPTDLLPPFNPSTSPLDHRPMTYWSEPLKEIRGTHDISPLPPPPMAVAILASPLKNGSGHPRPLPPPELSSEDGIEATQPVIVHHTEYPATSASTSVQPLATDIVSDPLLSVSLNSPDANTAAAIPPSSSAAPVTDLLQPPPTGNSSGEECPQIAAEVLDEEGEEVYGSADGRQTMITKGVVTAVAARKLVQYFHNKMSPHLFGYSLQLREFPYLSDGPRSITPFILAVECLLASERVSELSHCHSRLAEETTDMMIKSPAESWMTFPGYGTSHAHPGSVKQEQVLGHAVSALSAITADEKWEPELGIGPEEIVAACALAAFISERDQAKTIAVCAFTWAKGWTNYLRANPQAETVAESIGMITPLRRPTSDQVARVWLLAYIVAAQEFFNHNHPDEVFPTDISSWCNVLLPPSGSPPASDRHSSDVLLVFQARLHSLKLQWLLDRSRIIRGPDTPEAILEYVRAHKRLGDRMNSQLDWWAEDFDTYALEDDTKRQIHLDWLYARQIVNSVLVNHIHGGAEEEHMRLGHMRIAGECALMLLKRCESWDPPGSLANLPHTYFRMIALATVDVVKMLAEAEQGKIPSAICPISIKDFIPIVVRVCLKLQQTEVNRDHYCRQTAATLRQYIENLCQISNFQYTDQITIAANSIRRPAAVVTAAAAAGTAGTDGDVEGAAEGVSATLVEEPAS